MKVTRRTFLKIMAATAAVAMVPMPKWTVRRPMTYAELLRLRREAATTDLLNRFEERLWSYPTTRSVRLEFLRV